MGKFSSKKNELTTRLFETRFFSRPPIFSTIPPLKNFAKNLYPKKNFQKKNFLLKKFRRFDLKKSPHFFCPKFGPQKNFSPKYTPKNFFTRKSTPKKIFCPQNAKRGTPYSTFQNTPIFSAIPPVTPSVPLHTECDTV